MDYAICSHIPERNIAAVAYHHSQITLDGLDIFDVLACVYLNFAGVVVPVECLPLKVSRKDSKLRPL